MAQRPMAVVITRSKLRIIIATAVIQAIPLKIAEFR
jgi:hypothetical protein